MAVLDPASLASLKEKLDNHYVWPALYMFKFIIPAGREDELRGLFPLHVVSRVRPSGQGKYVSVTYEMMMPSSQSVVDVYRKASSVEGLIAL